MSWSDVKLGTGGLWIKLGAGEKITFHALSEPKMYQNHYFNDLKKGANCPGEGCPACDSGEKGLKSKTRFAMEVFVFEENACKLIGMSQSTAYALKELYDAYDGTLDNHDILMTRNGVGLNTTYSLIPKPSKFNPAMLTGQERPDLEAATAPTDAEAMQKLVDGVDPATEFTPSEYEPETENGSTSWAEEVVSEPVEEAPLDVAYGDEFPVVAQAAPRPVQPAPRPTPKAQPQPVKKPVQAVNHAERNELQKKVMKVWTTHPKLKVAGARERLLAKVAKGKQSVPSLSVPELKALLALLPR